VKAKLDDKRKQNKKLKIFQDDMSLTMLLSTTKIRDGGQFA
jgi:hypothetical protein